MAGLTRLGVLEDRVRVRFVAVPVWNGFCCAGSPLSKTGILKVQNKTF